MNLIYFSELSFWAEEVWKLGSCSGHRDWWSHTSPFRGRICLAAGSAIPWELRLSSFGQPCLQRAPLPKVAPFQGQLIPNDGWKQARQSQPFQPNVGQLRCSWLPIGLVEAAGLHLSSPSLSSIQLPSHPFYMCWSQGWFLVNICTLNFISVVLPVQGPNLQHSYCPCHLVRAFFT